MISYLQLQIDCLFEYFFDEEKILLMKKTSVVSTLEHEQWYAPNLLP